MFTADTPIDDINEQVMLSLINLNENNFFDFKQYLFPQDEWNEIASREYLKQVRRSMAAFANSRGALYFLVLLTSRLLLKSS